MKYHWYNTAPDPRREDVGVDGGQTGWKLHAVLSDDDDPRRTQPALCGLEPKRGWSLGLFITQRCQRCEKAIVSEFERRFGHHAGRPGPGRVRVKLAALLQRSFPVGDGGLKLSWEPEQLYPATGSYRTNVTLDCMRWEGFARHYREDGSFFTVWNVCSYVPMSELIKAQELTISENGEVVPAMSNGGQGVT